MATVQSLYENIQSVNIADVSSRSIDNTKEKIVELNEEQMYSGLRGDGTLIKPAYSGFTINEKEKKGQPYDRVTLKDKGYFYAGIHVVVENGKVTIFSFDQKNEELFDKYSTQRGNIFGLSTPYKTKYNDNSLRREFVGNMRKAFGL